MNLLQTIEAENIAKFLANKTIPDFRVAPGFDVPFFLSNVIHVEELPLVWR